MSNPEPRSSIRWTLTYIVLLAISASFLVGGYYAGKDTFWAHLLNELGIAGIVAVALALTIERLSANEFNQRAEEERDLLRQEFRKLAAEERAAIKQDVFFQAYGRMLPEEVRTELEHNVLQANFIRSRLYLKFELTIENDPKTSKEYVLSKVLTESVIRNISGEPRIFPIDYSVDPSPSDELADAVKYLEFSASGSETGFSLNESELKAITLRDGGRISLDSSKIRPVRVLPDVPTTLTTRYHGIRILDGGGIYFSFANHTCELELTVHVNNLDLEVFAEAHSPHALVPTRRHAPATGYYDWTITKPLLSYQAIHVTWRRARARTPQPG